MLPYGPYNGPDAVVYAETIDEAIYEDVELGVVECSYGGQCVCEIVER